LYMHTPPVQPVCGAADGDPNHPDLHKPGWDIVFQPGELELLCPWLFSELKKVDDLFLLYQDHNIRKALCLFQARGCLLAFERRIGQAVLMLASLPLDFKNNLLADLPPLYLRWARHPVCRHEYFQSTVFKNICYRVHKSQKEEFEQSKEMFSAVQKSWVSVEMGRIMPKLHAGTRLSQCILQGQRQSAHEVIGSLEVLHSKMNWIISNLQNNGQDVSEDGREGCDGDDAAMAPSHSPTVLPSTSWSTPPSFVSTNVPLICYNSKLNSKGKKRLHKPPSPVLNRPFSLSNISATDYWTEYKYGVNGCPSLESMELAHGSKWRSDTKYARVDGRQGTSLKASWSLQKPIYMYIEYHMVGGKSEGEAIQLIQDVFDRLSYRHSGRPKLNECKKEFVNIWGSIQS
jgi:hypothetical protein